MEKDIPFELDGLAAPLNTTDSQILGVRTWSTGLVTDSNGIVDILLPVIYGSRFAVVFGLPSSPSCLALGT